MLLLNKGLNLLSVLAKLESVDSLLLNCWLLTRKAQKFAINSLTDLPLTATCQRLNRFVNHWQLLASCLSPLSTWSKVLLFFGRSSGKEWLQSLQQDLLVAVRVNEPGVTPLRKLINGAIATASDGSGSRKNLARQVVSPFLQQCLCPFLHGEPPVDGAYFNVPGIDNQISVQVFEYSQQ
jgi:hypothetical protein